MNSPKHILDRVRRELPPQLWVLVALFVVLWISAPGFATSSNLSNVGRIGAVLALAACGQAVVIITGGLDLSAGSLVAVMSVISVLEVHLGTLAAFGLAILLALGVGAVNGLLVARFDVPPFLATLGMLTALHGLGGLLVGGIAVEKSPGGAFSWPSNGNLGPVSAPLALAIVGMLTLAVVLRRTRLGRIWYLIGSNPAAARAAGLRTRWSLFSAYVTAAAFVSVAGIILTARVHSGQPDLDPTLAFEAIAACAIGGLSMSGGTGRVSGIIVGVLIVAFVTNGLTLLNVSSDLHTIAVGALTIASVLLASRRWYWARWRRAGAGVGMTEQAEASG
jgi:ribose/xylose/arabinose/galactoside ABC-type transport system permease subunit